MVIVTIVVEVGDDGDNLWMTYGPFSEPYVVRVNWKSCRDTPSLINIEVNYLQNLCKFSSKLSSLYNRFQYVLHIKNRWYEMIEVNLLILCYFLSLPYLVFTMTSNTIRLDDTGLIRPLWSTSFILNFLTWSKYISYSTHYSSIIYPFHLPGL